MKCHRVYADAGDCDLATLFLLFRCNQTGAKLRREVFRIGDIVGIAFSSAPVDDRDATEDTADNADGCSCHAEVTGFLPAETGEGRADCGSGSVTAVETGCHHKTEAGI